MNSRKLQSHTVVVSVVVLVLVSLACSGVSTPSTGVPTATSGQPAAKPTPIPSTSKADFQVLPFQYTVQDVGDGWKEGTVVLGFVNSTDRLLDPQKVSFQLQEATLETAEGKAYPANLHFAHGGPPWIPSNTFQVMWGNGLPIPSKLPVSMIYAESWTSPDTRGFQDIYNIVLFRFAPATHPVRLILRSSTFKFIIEVPEPVVSIPTPLAGFITQSLDDFAAALTRRNSKLQLTFGKCVRIPEPTIPYTVTNSNQLDEEKVEVPFAVWYSSGVFDMMEWGRYVREGGDQKYQSFLAVKAGPGQSVKRDLNFLGERRDWGVPMYLVAYSPDQSQAQIYKLDYPEEK